MLALAAPLLVAAAVLRPPPARSGRHLARALARPLALPLLWHGLGQARHQEPPEALAARGRQILALLPQWTDGHVLFASELAFAASSRAGDADAAAARLIAALATLEAAIVEHPPGAVDYLSAMASFLEIRAAQDPAVAAALRRRLGVEPEDAADRYLARAEALAPSSSLSDRRTYLRLPAISSALRTGDRRRALLGIERMRARLAANPDDVLAQRWRQSLDRLAGFLTGAAGITLHALRDDPLLHDMVEALEGSPR
jgi:hypothetical protein